MDSPVSSIGLKQRPRSLRHSLMGWSAVLRADLTSLSKSWIVRIWLLLLMVSFLMLPVAMLASSRLTPIPASAILAAYLTFFLTVWSTVIIVLSAGSVSSEADIVADGILSRACTRTQYIMAKISARIMLVGGVYLIGSGAAAYASWRYGLNDVTWTTMLAGIAIVGTALLMLVALGVTMSVIFNNTIVSVIGLLLLWYVAGAIFTFAGVPYMSPTSLGQNLPQILRDSSPPRVLSASATETSLSVRFSKGLNPDAAERIDSYQVETHGNQDNRAETAVYNKSEKSVILSGYHFKKDRVVKVKVEGITDLAGNVISPADDSATSKPVSASGGDSDVMSRADESHTRDHVTDKTDEKADVVPGDSRGSVRRANMPPRVVRVTATPVSASITFSQGMSSKKAEDVKNYTVESPPGAVHTPKTAAYDGSTRTVLLGGLTFRKGDPVKVTAKKVTSLRGKEMVAGENSGTFREVQNWKYFAGFGLPALIFMALGVVWFSRRDL